MTEANHNNQQAGLDAIHALLEEHAFREVSHIVHELPDGKALVLDQFVAFGPSAGTKDEQQTSWNAKEVLVLELRMGSVVEQYEVYRSVTTDPSHAGALRALLEYAIS